MGPFRDPISDNIDVHFIIVFYILLSFNLLKGCLKIKKRLLKVVWNSLLVSNASNWFVCICNQVCVLF